MTTYDLGMTIARPSIYIRHSYFVIRSALSALSAVCS